LRWARKVCDTPVVPQRWLQLTVDAPLACVDAIANFLLENGAPGIETRDAGSHVAIITYLETDAGAERLTRYCVAIGWEPPPGAIRIRPFDDRDWSEEWKQHVHTQSIGDGLFVCPSWKTDRPANRIPIVIDPGMAFGTGGHASTRDCLVLLERALDRRRVQRALDLGTGSGILAIALAKLGVPSVWALDTDPTARAVASANAALNQVSTEVRIVESWNRIPATFDLVVANLWSNLLEALAPRLADTTVPGGILIVAGFLAADECRVRTAYVASGFTVSERREEDQWVALALTRNDDSTISRGA
jgi:ribosomal protein L11 methyltransferase